MMTFPLLLDLAIALILLIFAIRGVKQGFVRALCSFLAVFIAFFGAIFITKTLTPLAIDVAAPHVLPAIVQRVEAQPIPLPTQDFSAQETSLILQKIGLPETWGQLIAMLQASPDTVQTAASSPSQLFAAFLLKIIASAVIFILSFVLLLLLWSLISRSLDLVARLPVLNFCNRILGAVLGIAKGLIFLLLLRWVLFDMLGLIPLSAIEATYSYHYLYTIFPSFQFYHLYLF